MRWFGNIQRLAAADPRVSIIAGLGYPGSAWKIITVGPVLTGSERKLEALINRQLHKKRKGSLSSKVIRKAKEWAVKLPVPGDAEISGGLKPDCTLTSFEC